MMTQSERKRTTDVRRAETRTKTDRPEMGKTEREGEQIAKGRDASAGINGTPDQKTQRSSTALDARSLGALLANVRLILSAVPLSQACFRS